MNTNNKWITGLLFLAAIGLAVGADSFRQVNDSERRRFNFEFNQQVRQALTIDLAQQGLLKYYLQPGTISLSGSGKNMPPQGNLYVKFSGETALLSQGGKLGNWKNLTDNTPLLPNRRGIIPLNVEVDIPYARTRQYEVGGAVLEFRHDDQPVQVIDVQFINSKYRDR